MEEDEVVQTFVSTEEAIVDCLLEIIDSYEEWDWENIGLDVYIEDDKNISLADFKKGERHNLDRGANATINPMYGLDEIENNKREHLLIYFYLCVTTIRNRAEYERMKKEDNDKKAGCNNNNEMGSSRGNRGKTSNDAEHPLPDSQPGTKDGPRA